MRIAIIWSHSTWKSTLIKELDTLGYPIIEEVSRRVIKKVWIEPITMSEIAFLGFETMVYNVQIQEEDKLQDFISDRWVIDILAYCKWRIAYDFIKPWVDKRLLEVKYDYIFYIPIEFGLVQDDVRSKEKTYQQEIDNNIKELIKEYNLKVITIKWSVEERVNKVVQLIWTPNKRIV